MMNSYISLCLVALVATIQSMPTIDDNHNNNTASDNDENESFLIQDNPQDDRHHNKRTSNQFRKIIDGTKHFLKAARITYQQRLRDGQCVVEYDGKFLTEYSVIQFRRKLYRVEDCLLERVFHACGPNLLLMLNVVCRVIEQYQPAPSTTTTTITTTPKKSFRQKTIPASAAIIHQLYPREVKTLRVITESCCQNLCTLSELTRYCHR